MSEYEHLFGPVPSRRFGRSLGVDLVPMKTCGFSCVFCQLGATECTTVVRREYVPTQEVLHELRDWLASDETADCITLAGSGEPTLHSAFGDVFDFVRKHSSVETLLLSNGSLFFLQEVRTAAAKADIVKVSVSAWDQESFELVNRPHPDLQFDKVMGGLRKFRAEFDGRLLVEVFILDGANSDRGDMKKIARLVKDIGPDAVHLNTAMRPPADLSARPVAAEALEALADLFEPRAEVIADFTGSPTPGGNASLTQDSVLSILRRHPSTSQQLATMFGVEAGVVDEELHELSRANLVKKTVEKDQAYYSAI